MDARLIIAATLLLAGGLIAVAGAAPQSAITPTEATTADPGPTTLKGTVGTVDAEDGTFTLTDGETTILVAYGPGLPAAVEPGNTLVAKGTLDHQSEGPLLSASEIQTGCPSQYGA